MRDKIFCQSCAQLQKITRKFLLQRPRIPLKVHTGDIHSPALTSHLCLSPKEYSLWFPERDQIHQPHKNPFPPLHMPPSTLSRRLSKSRIIRFNSPHSEGTPSYYPKIWTTSKCVSSNMSKTWTPISFSEFQSFKNINKKSLICMF